MVQIHPQARTTPAVRADIARSTEPASVVAKRFFVAVPERLEPALCFLAMAFERLGGRNTV